MPVIDLHEEHLRPWFTIDWSVFALYALFVLGLCYIIGHSSISYPVRLFIDRFGFLGRWVVTLLECPKCLGYHIGWVAAALHMGPFGELGFAGWLLGAFITSALMLIADRCLLFGWDAEREERRLHRTAQMQLFERQAHGFEKAAGWMDAAKDQLKTEGAVAAFDKPNQPGGHA